MEKKQTKTQDGSKILVSNAIAKHRLWWRMNEEVDKRKRHEISNALLDLVPKCLRRLFSKDSLMVSELFEKGVVNRIYSFDDRLEYGFRSLRDLERRLQKLKVAWNSYVEIDIRDDGRAHLLHVDFIVPKLND